MDETGHRRLILGALSLGLVVSAFFGFGAVRSAVRLASMGPDPGLAQVEQIRGWMTVPYIARVFNLPADELYALIGVPSEGASSKSLRKLNRDFFPDRGGYVVDRAKAAVRVLTEEKIGSEAGAP